MTQIRRSEPSYRLVPVEHRSAPAPLLDEDQRRVVEHPGGPLLVLAGPGTGKTTTLVEAIAQRIEVRGAGPEQILALTFSRKAAEQVRDRVIARVGRTTSTTLSATFHSFAYGLIRRHTPPELYDAPVRLLSAPEQDVVLQQILTKAPESVVWPAGVQGALGTRGFAAEVAQVLARAQEKGLGFEALHRLGVDEQVPEFVAAAAFMAQYDEVIAQQNLLDYPSLIATAVRMLQDPDQPVRDELRAQFRHVFVDEYQDTDPAQVALLRAIAGDGRDLIVVGDPHQSIYGFRGAQVRGILEFPDRFPRADGSPAETVVLGTTRRFGARLLHAAGNVAARLPLTGSIDASARARFAAPTTAVGEPGRVDILTFDSDRAEAEHIADLLRRAHLEDAVPWSDMAVLVRSGRSTIPALRRALIAAAIPVEVASDDTPLIGEPAVRPLVEALAAVVHYRVADPAAPGYVDPQRAVALLTSPLAALDAVDVRTLARRLRLREQDRPSTDQTPRRSPELLRDALFDPGILAGLDEPSAAERRAAGLADLLDRTRSRLEAGAEVEELLWQLWSGTDWPLRLRLTSSRGGVAARLAHRDLDAVCALFEAAARAEDQRGHTSAETFVATLAAQQIPADTLAERGVRDDAVRLLTAHRAKGLEWPLVVVAHVQEQAWPDLRRRGTLLRPDRIGAAGILPPLTARELLAEERRLFYVACTRARRRLIVTAVASSDDDGEQPSRFCHELFPEGHRVRHLAGRPRRPLSLNGLVAELRRTLADPSQPEPLRLAAELRLARLAAAHRAGLVAVPAADPATWWGTMAPTLAEQPLAADPVEITASALVGLTRCPAQWFWSSQAGGVTETTQAQGFGNLVHALADRIGRGELPASPTVTDDIAAELDRVWTRIPFRTPWSSDRLRTELREVLDRLVEHLSRDRDRTLIGTEAALVAELTLPDGQPVRVRGYADRLELDAQGRVVVIDLKTGRSAPTKDEVAQHPQLGLYQRAVTAGAVPGHDRAGGAELWQLRANLKSGLKVQPQPPPQPDPDGTWPVDRQLMEAVGTIRAESFPARPGRQCEHCHFTRLCPAQNAGTVLS